jgi:hypothetical protein
MDSKSRAQFPCASNATPRNPAGLTEMDATHLLNLALVHLGSASPTAQSLMRIGVTLAQEVNKATDLPGRAKLDLVIHALRDLLATPAVSERLSPEQSTILRNVVDNVIPEMISLVVEASRGAFALKKPSVGCLASLFCRQVAAHGPAQVDQVAKTEKEPGGAMLMSVAKDTVELSLRDVAVSVQSKSEPSDAPTPNSA